jgi:hypothetical protein
VIDGIDDMDTGFINKVTKFIESASDPFKSAKTTQGRRKIGVKFHMNPIVITCCDRYSKHVTAALFKMKPEEVKCNAIQHPQLITLVKNACMFEKIPFDASVQNLVSASNGDITSLLASIQFQGIVGNDKIDAKIMEKDPYQMDLFTCCKQLLQPKVSDDDIPGSWEEYSNVWDQGGDKVITAMYNSFPSYVAYGPKGLVSLGDICNRFSDLDLLQYESSEVGEAAILALKLTMKMNLEGVAIRATKKLQVDVKTRMNASTTHVSKSLSMCGLGDMAAREKLYYINVIRNIEADKKLTMAMYTPDPQYELTHHVGKYLSLFDLEKNVWMVVDMFEGDEELTKKKPSTTHPKLQAMKLISHFTSS